MNVIWDIFRAECIFAIVGMNMEIPRRFVAAKHGRTTRESKWGTLAEDMVLNLPCPFTGLTSKNLCLRLPFTAEAMYPDEKFMLAYTDTAPINTIAYRRSHTSKRVDSFRCTDDGWMIIEIGYDDDTKFKNCFKARVSEGTKALSLKSNDWRMFLKTISNDFDLL